MELEQQSNRSEVARLLRQIGEEYESAQAGLVGYAITSRHQMINARLETIGQLHEELYALVGDSAMHLIAEQLEHLSDDRGYSEAKASSAERNIHPCPHS